MLREVGEGLEYEQRINWEPDANRPIIGEWAKVDFGIYFLRGFEERAAPLHWRLIISTWKFQVEPFHVFVILRQ